MKLIVHELTASGVEQQLTAPRNMVLSAVRPHIYRHNMPSGSLKVQVFDDTNTMIAESESVSASSIGTQAFFHGYVRFYVNAGLQKDRDYKFKLVGADGYSFSESAYIGWCNGFDLAKYENTFTPDTSLNYPLDLDIWERKVK